MDIEQKKQRVLDLFLSVHQISGNEQIFISDATLVENGMGGRDFWDVVCPLLQTEGVLREYGDPDTPLSSFVAFYHDNERYKMLLNRRYPGLLQINFSARAPAQLPEPTGVDAKELEAEMDALIKKLRTQYRHRFLVDPDRLIDKKSGKKSQMDFDGKRLITYQKKRYSFHLLRRGERAAQLDMFKLLWARRREMRGKTMVRKGERIEAATCAVQLGLLQSTSEFHDNRSVKNKVASLLKGLQRIFRGKFPATVDIKGGILLTVTHP